jgi:hypothetical protein
MITDPRLRRLHHLLPVRLSLPVFRRYLSLPLLFLVVIPEGDLLLFLPLHVLAFNLLLSS